MAEKTQKKETKKQEYKRKFNNAIKAQQRFLKQLKNAGIETADLKQSFRPKEYRAGSANRVKADTQRMKVQYGQQLAEKTGKTVIGEGSKRYEPSAVVEQRKMRREERRRKHTVSGQYETAQENLREEIIRLKEQGYEVADDVVEIANKKDKARKTKEDLADVNEALETITERAWKPDKEGNLVTKAQTDEARAEKARITRERNKLSRRQKIAKIIAEGRAAGYDLSYITDIIAQYNDLPEHWDTLHNMYIAENSGKTAKRGEGRKRKVAVAISDPFEWIKRSLKDRFGWNEGQQAWNAATGRVEAAPINLADKLSEIWDRTLKTAKENGWEEWLADWISQHEYEIAECFDIFYASSDLEAIMQAYSRLIDILSPFDYIDFDERVQLEEMFDEYNYSEEDYI